MKMKRHYFWVCGLMLGIGTLQATATPVNAEPANALSEQQSQQQRTVSGRVLDEKGEPVIGANIVVSGAAIGSITDLNGQFQLSVPSGAQSLQISYIGYKKTEVSIAGTSTVTVTLEPESTGLDELVVIGYGTVKKRDLTGAVSSVKTADIVQTPTANAMEAIQGRIPGMDITRTGGGAGAGVSILIRGTKTLGYTDMYGNKSRNTEPLFIIDGVQGGSYADLNPNDIESIDVLKDASSTAIYGSLGANGVVIITTKKGKENKVSVSLDSYYGVNGFVDYPTPRMGDSYLNVRREAYRTVGQWASPADDYKIFTNEEWSAIQNNQWVNWVDELTRQGTQQSHNVTFSSGKDKVKSYLSLGYFNEQGIFEDDDITRYTLRANLDYEVRPWMTVGVNTQLTYYDQNSVPASALTQATTYIPLGTPYNEDGSINLFPVSGDAQRLSPLANYADENRSVDNTVSIKNFSSAYLLLQPFKQLTFRSNLSTSLATNRSGEYNGLNSTDQFGGSYTNNASVYSGLYRNYSWDNILTYNESFGDHTLEATAITTWMQTISENYGASGYNQLLDSYLFYSLGSTDPASRTIYSNYVQQQTFGVAGRLSYNYAGRYFLTATARWDGSSTLAPGHQWDFFPSVSAAWRLSDEAFMENSSDWLSNLKLRASYGTTGNAGAPAYATQGGSVSANTMFAFNDKPATVYQFGYLVGNSELGWETSTTTNIGLDFGIFNNRVDLNIDLYNIDTDNILMARSLPPSTGAGGSSSAQFSTYQNIGKTRNRGIEIALNTVNVDTRDFKWNSTLTFAANQEEIVSLVTGEDIIQGQNAEVASLLIGRPINSFYSYKLNGIWQLGEEAEMAKYKLNGTENAFKPGSLRVEDFNGDGNITADDRQYLGSRSPKWTAGFNNTFRYKNFDFGAYLVMRWGQMIDAQFLGRFDPSGVSNSPDYLDYWTPENPSNDFPQPKKDGKLYDYYGYMSLNYVDGSYFKVKNISMGYSLPTKITDQLGISKLRFYATASNPFTVAKSHLIKFYDPERGGDEKMPLTKQIVFGLNLSF